MTYDALDNALTMVKLAIQRCLLVKERLAYTTVLEYAEQYGKRTCSKAQIEAALATIDLDKLNELITEISGVERLARVKALRDLTSLPLLRCKQALEQHGWDMMAAQTYLRDQHKPIGIMNHD